MTLPKSFSVTSKTMSRLVNLFKKTGSFLCQSKNAGANADIFSYFCCWTTGGGKSSDLIQGLKENN